MTPASRSATAAATFSLAVLLGAPCGAAAPQGSEPVQDQAPGASGVDDELQTYTFIEEPMVHEALDAVMSGVEFQRVAGARHEATGNRNDPASDRKTTTESGAETAPTGPSWIQRLSDWLRGLGREQTSSSPDAASSSRSSNAGTLLIYIMAAVVLIAATAFIIKSIMQSPSSVELGPRSPEPTSMSSGVAPGELAPESYLDRAQSHAERGRYKQAIRELLLGAMSFAERQGLIRHRKGLTNRDYFWALRGRPRESLGIIASAFEKVYFGRREASRVDYQICRDRYELSFRLERAQ